MKESYSFHKDKLKGEYLEVFDKIELYGLTNSIDSEVFEERMMDLLDMMLVGQQKGAPVEKIVGKNVEDFCEAHFYDGDTWDKIKRFPKRLVTVMWILLVLVSFDFIPAVINLKSGMSIWSIKDDMSPFFLGAITGIVVFGIFERITRRFVFSSKWLTTNKFLWMFVIIFIGSIAIEMKILEAFEISVPALIVMIIAGAYLAIYYIINAINNYKKYGTIRKPKDEHRVSFWGMVNEEMERDFPQTLKKRFDKKNARLAKKGKPLMTEEEYHEKIRKEAESDKKGNYFVIILLVVLVLGISISEMITNNVVEGLIFMAILSVIELPILLAVRSSIKKDPKGTFIRKCDEMGITIIDYAKRPEGEEAENVMKENENGDQLAGKNSNKKDETEISFWDICDRLFEYKEDE